MIRKKYISLLSNRLLLDTFWQVFGGILNRLSYFIGLFILSGILSKELYGVFGYIYNSANSIGAINSNGLGIPIRRDLSRAKVGQKVLYSSLVIMLIFAFFICSFLYIFQVSIFALGVYNLYLFLLSVSISISLFLNYYYSGLQLFKYYNLSLIPISLFLPMLLFVVNECDVAFSVFLFLGVTMCGNLIQIYYLLKRKQITLGSFNLSYFAINRKKIIPCYLQAILGLPIYIIVQTIVITKWDNLILIGEITLATQILNVNNIFATKMLSVFSTRFSSYYFIKNRIPMRLFFKLLIVYLFVIIGLSVLVCLLIPAILSTFNSNYSESLLDIQYFVMMNIVISLSWYFVEFFHSIEKSWISLYLNIINFIGILLVFYVFYYKSTTFNLIDYANCLTSARVLSLILSIYYIIKIK